MNAIELDVQRRLTKAFIDESPESVVLQGFDKESNGSGGFRLTPQPPRDPQVMRLIPISTTAFERLTLDGAAVTPQFVLMGEFNCEMQRGDKFELDGKRYEIVHIQEKHEYQKKGETVLLGDA